MLWLKISRLALGACLLYVEKYGESSDELQAFIFVIAWHLLNYLYICCGLCNLNEQPLILKKFMKYIISAFLVLTIALGSCSSSSGKFHNNFDDLDYAIEHRDEAIAKREGDIESLRDILQSVALGDEQKYAILGKLVEQYFPYQFDSMVYYMHKRIDVAKKLGDKTKIQSGYLDLAYRYCAAGNYLESLDILKVEVDTVGMCDSIREFYNYAFYKNYDQLVIYSPDTTLNSKYYALREKYSSRMSNPSLLPGSLPMEYMLSSYVNSRRMDEAKEYAKELLVEYGEEGHIAATVKFFMSIVALLEGDEAKREQFLIESATIDMNLAIRDNTSLHHLSHILLEQGDIKKAMGYNRVVLDDANFFNAFLRKWQDSSVASDIERAYNEYSLQVSKLTYAIIGIILVFVVIAVLFIIKLSSQSRRLTLAKKRLEEAYASINSANAKLVRVNEKLTLKGRLIAESNAVKEEYIANFMAICSEYIDKLISQRKQVSKLLRDGKTDELKRLYPMRGASETTEIEEFYNLFDEIFTNLYPTFVDEVNQLLREDSQIELRSGEKLNTELRIFAMMRLGITDLAKIANLLRYSMSTIYNYRSKIRGGAICDKQEFETLIRSIGEVRLNE